MGDEILRPQRPRVARRLVPYSPPVRVDLPARRGRWFGRAPISSVVEGARLKKAQQLDQERRGELELFDLPQ